MYIRLCILDILNTIRGKVDEMEVVFIDLMKGKG